MATDKIEIVVDAKVGEALRNISKVHDKTKDMAKPGLFEQMKKNWLGLTVATGALVGALKKSVDAFATQEKAEKTLAAAMKNAGTFTEAAFRHNLKYAESLQKITTYGDEAILGVQKLLTTFGFEGETLDKLTKATLDLAAAKDMDLASAADIVAKSVGGSTNALSQYGVVIEGAAGSTERATMAVDQISKLFGGSAESSAKTFGGQMEQIKNQFGDFMERVGEGVSKALIPMMDIFNKLPGPIKTVAMAVGVLTAAFVALNVVSGGIAIVLGLVVTAAVGAGVAMSVSAENAKTLKDDLDKLAESAYVNQSNIDKMTASYKSMNPKKLADEIDFLNNAIKANTDWAAWLATEIENLIKTTGAGSQATLRAENEYQKTSSKIKEYSAALKTAQDVLEGKRKAEENATNARIEYTKAVQAAIDKHKTAEQKTQEEIDGLSTLIELQKKYGTLTSDRYQALLAAREKLVDSLEKEEEQTSKLTDEQRELLQTSLNAAQELATAFTSFLGELAATSLAFQLDEIKRWEEAQYATLESTQMLKNLQQEEDLESLATLEAERDRAARRGDSRTAKAKQNEIDKINLEKQNEKERDKIRAEAEKKEIEAKRKAGRINNALAIAQAAINVPMAISNVFAQTFGGIGTRTVASIAAGVTSGLNLAAVIAKATVPQFARGGSFITEGPQVIQVGDNSSGAERVTVEPLSGNPGSGGGSVYNFYGYDADQVRTKILRTEGGRGFQ